MLLELTVDGIPQQIMSRWAEFVAYGPGPASDLLARNYNGTYGGQRWWRCGGGDIFDRGESPVHTDIPVSSGSSCVCSDGTGGLSDGSSWTDGPWVLRQYANPATDELEGIYSTIQGLDPDGLIIRSNISDGTGVDAEWINGVQLGISSGSSYTETTQQFSKVTAYTKPRTNGYVKLTAWNGYREIELSNYEPWETTASYHRYFSPFLQERRCDDDPCRRIVLARARKRFVPIQSDEDVLMISNILVLQEMLIAQALREQGDLEGYAVHKLTAVDLLKKESVAYNGKVRTPAMTFQRGFSIGALPAIR
ncbi:MAG TPA: hypothetical protein VHS96_08900 [Bacteroidia bacterium]|nr:hypothetical protein [Bacteroidia bacterium]